MYIVHIDESCDFKTEACVPCPLNKSGLCDSLLWRHDANAFPFLIHKVGTQHLPIPGIAVLMGLRFPYYKKCWANNLNEWIRIKDPHPSKFNPDFKLLYLPKYCFFTSFFPIRTFYPLVKGKLYPLLHRNGQIILCLFGKYIINSI